MSEPDLKTIADIVHTNRRRLGLDHAALQRVTELEAMQWCLEWFGPGVPVSVATAQRVRGLCHFTGDCNPPFKD